MSRPKKREGEIQFQYTFADTGILRAYFWVIKGVSTQTKDLPILYDIGLRDPCKNYKFIFYFFSEDIIY